MEIRISTEKLGDCILQEPALTALAVAIRQPISLYIDNPCLRPYFAGHPCLILTQNPSPDALELSALAAMNWAIRHKMPFAAGYFPQLGLNPVHYQRLHPRMWQSPDRDRRTNVLICPFSYSDHGNICPPDEFWAGLVPLIGGQVLSVGSENDPPIAGSTNLRGLTLWELASQVVAARAVVSVETGILHLTNGLANSVVFLSSATPVSLCRPAVQRCHVIRAERPAAFSVAATLSAIRSLLE